MKKNIGLIFILLIMCLCSGCGEGGYNSEKLTENIEVIQYSWVEEGVWADYEKTGLLVCNNNDISVDVDIEVKCYDEIHNYVDTRIAEVYALAPNTEYFYLCTFEDGIDKIEYTYSGQESDYKGLVVDEDIFISHGIGYPMTVGVHNLSGQETIECNCSVLFYDRNNEIMGADSVEMHNGEIPDGEKVMEEMDTPLDAAGMDIYINAYIEEE